MIAEDGDNFIRRSIRSAVWYERGIKALLDEDLGHASVYRIKTLEYARFYRPFSNKSSYEGRQAARLFQLGTLLQPNLTQGPEFFIGCGPIIPGQIIYGLPLHASPPLIAAAVADVWASTYHFVHCRRWHSIAACGDVCSLSG